MRTYNIYQPGLEITAADIGNYTGGRYSLAFVYRNGEDDREGKLGADARRGTDEEFAYSAEDKDNAATAAVAYEIRGTCVVIEFDEDDVRCLLTRIGAL